MLWILTYHRVDEPGRTPALNPRLISASPEAFELHLRWLSKDFDPVSGRDILDAVTAGKALPSRAVHVTFDDAYRDFALYAWPILQRHAVPVTLFVPTAYPDRPDREFWWDRVYRACMGAAASELVDPALGRLPLGDATERAATCAAVQGRVKTMPHEAGMQVVDRVCAALGVPPNPESPVLGWEELRRLRAEGVLVASHSEWHPLFTRISPERARRELQESQRALRDACGEAPPIFAYPSGAFDASRAQIVGECGFTVALTQVPGPNRLPGQEPLMLRRFNITQRSDVRRLSLRLTPWVSQFERWRKRKRIAAMQRVTC
jgi:peptidoglycan/xylan/chitin deacetylase (PgdA/CDA1 family)